MIQNLSPKRIVDSLPNQYFQDFELLLKLQPDGLIKIIPYIPYEIKFQLFGSIIYDYEVIKNLLDIVSNLLNNTQPEKNDSYFHLIFKLMMDEQESLARDYLIILFEYLGWFQSIEIKKFHEAFQSEYQKYEKAFLQATLHGFTYNSQTKI